ncbi:hypothetical protein C0Q70_14596 [Pomacea canaliculata]|uniref:Uncharacterized protein n=1 Tax=Pomacea canaliculata TaxID=400727 RepID=A0A2T7NSJ8_POMCA|nr:hypothetical protein C0Q70_14596 [Pomacea canaliculata]
MRREDVSGNDSGEGGFSHGGGTPSPAASSRSAALRYLAAPVPDTSEAKQEEAGSPQEFGEFQQMLQMTVGARMSSMLATTCCVIRQQRCSTPQRTPAANTTLDLLEVPGAYLPSDASGLTFDFTFVTPADMKRYSCMYSGTRDLVCRLRDVMQSGWMGWGLSSMGRGGLMAMAGMGEEMQEMMEQMMAGWRSTKSKQPCVQQMRSLTDSEVDHTQHIPAHNHGQLDLHAAGHAPGSSSPDYRVALDNRHARGCVLATATTSSRLTTTVPSIQTTSRLQPTTTWEEIIRYLVDLTKTSTPANVGNDAVSVPGPPVAPDVRSTSASPRFIPPPESSSTELADVGRAGPEGGVETGTVLIVALTVAGIILSCILLFFLLWRRRRKQRGKMKDMGASGTATQVMSEISSISQAQQEQIFAQFFLPEGNQHFVYTTHDVQHVIDDSSDDDDEKEGYDGKKEAEESEKDEDERYTPVKAMSDGSAGHVSPLPDGDEENNTYASLDETSMLTSCRLQTSAADVTSASTPSSTQSTEGSAAYLSMNRVNRKLPSSQEKTLGESEMKYCNTGNGLHTSSPEEEKYLAMAGQKLGSDDAGYAKMDEPIVLSKKTRNNQKVPQFHEYLNLAAKGVNRAQMALPQPVASPNEQPVLIPR